MIILKLLRLPQISLNSVVFFSGSLVLTTSMKLGLYSNTSERRRAPTRSHGISIILLPDLIMNVTTRDDGRK